MPVPSGKITTTKIMQGLEIVPEKEEGNEEVQSQVSNETKS